MSNGAVMIDGFKSILVDVDGCFLNGDSPTPGAYDLASLAGDRLILVSNNSTDTPTTMAARLRAFGLDFTEQRIVLAGAAMVDVVATAVPRARVLILGNAEICGYAAAAGLSPVDRDPDAVMLCRDLTLTYPRLQAAIHAVAGGVPLYVANPDASHPGADGKPVPETGVLLAAIQAAVPTVEPIIVGKPELTLFEIALGRFGVAASDAVMIGDNPDTDGRGAARMGMAALMIGDKPDSCAEDLAALLIGEPVFWRDATDRRRSQSDEAVANGLINGIDALAEAVAIWDSEDRLIMCNQIYRQLFNDPELVRPGVTFPELVELNIRSSVPSRLGPLDDVPGHPDVYRRLRLDYHRRCKGEFLIEIGEGIWRQVRERRTRDGGVVGIYTDISDRMRIQNELKQANIDAEEANRAKSLFLAAASHDLRQPLHAVGIFVSALTAKIDDPDCMRLISNIENCLQTTNNLFDALLDISRLDAGVLDPVAKPVFLDDLFAAVAREYGPVAERKGVRLRRPPTTAWTLSDPVMLGRIIRNFVSNAVKFTDTGGVLMGVRKRGGALRIDVVDTGPGLSYDQLERVFQEFERLDVGSHRQQGLGLGLAIADKLAHLLGHAIEVRSLPDRGTRFSVVVPLANDVERHTEDLKMATVPESVLEAGASVIVIDDDLDILDAMTALLEGWGGVVETANSRQSLGQLLARPSISVPALLIVDYNLRDDANALTLIADVRRRFKQDIPTLIVTGDTTPARLQATRTLGFPVIHKPLTAMRLRAAMASVMPSG